jgi:prophage regulatory protein
MSETIFTIPEVAQHLKLSKSKVYSLVQQGKIPHVRIGRNVRIKERELQAWLEQQSFAVRA